MILLALPAVAAAFYWALAWYAAFRQLRQVPVLSPFQPPVSILKPIRGRDERFFDALVSHAQQHYPEFEILFGVRDPQDAALADIYHLQAEFPELPIRIITDAPDAPNGKAAMLIALAAAARYPTLLVNDSDIVVSPDYLQTVVAPLADLSVGVVTCLYRARGASFPARFEALGITTDFAPSVLVARTVGVVEFALGSTMVFRKEQLQQIGGFATIAHYLADDYQLGARISKLGYRVVLAACPVETNLGAGSWRDVWKHQVRWSRTVRVSRGSGYVGSVITHATLWSIVAIAAGAWPVALVCLALRFAAAATTARALQDSQVAWWLIPFRDLFGTAVWAAGLAGSTVEWRGETLRLRKDGRIS